MQHLSAEAIAQAVVVKQADVEWRRLRALATAWEIHALEQHQRFLLMTLEDDGETYAAANAESLTTSLKEILSSTTEELQNRIDFCVAAYGPDAMSFAIGDKQLDLVEDIARVHFNPSALHEAVEARLPVAHADSDATATSSSSSSDDSVEEFHQLRS